MALDDNKAGMQGIDKERINEVIESASRGSRFWANRQRRAERLQSRTKAMLKRMELIPPADIAKAQQEVDTLVLDLEAGRDLSRTIVHVDMDAFFAAVEIRDRPQFRDVPLAVGSSSMLSTSNYAARRFGVRAAMPGFIGKKLCPQLIIVPCNYQKYTQESGIIRDILLEYDPELSSMSLDEAYLDLTDCLAARRLRNAPSMLQRIRFIGKCKCRLPYVEDTAEDCLESDSLVKRESEMCGKCNQERIRLIDQVQFGNDIQQIVQEIRFRIHQKTGLTASAGIACNGMLAKVCTDQNKPNGQTYLAPDLQAIRAFVRNLPVRKICGIGAVLSSMLSALEITTCGHLYDKRALLKLLFTQVSFTFLIRVALGLGSCDFSWSDGRRKSISVERTFGEISVPGEMMALLQDLSEALAEDVRKKQVQGKCVSIKVKTIDFDVKTRAHSLGHYIHSAQDIFNTAKALLNNEIQQSAPAPLRLRLLGVRLSSFAGEAASGSPEKNCALYDTRHQQRLSQYLKRDSASASALDTPTGPKAVSTAEQYCALDTNSHPTAAGSSAFDADTDFSALDVGNAEPSALDIATELTDYQEHYNPASDAESTNSSDVLLVQEQATEQPPALAPDAACPVCGWKLIRCGGLGDLNDHIDQCLSRQTIKSIVRQENERERQSGICSAGKAKSGPNLGKRSRSRVQETGGSLDAFWKRPRN